MEEKGWSSPNKDVTSVLHVSCFVLLLRQPLQLSCSLWSSPLLDENQLFNVDLHFFTIFKRFFHHPKVSHVESTQMIQNVWVDNQLKPAPDGKYNLEKRYFEMLCSCTKGREEHLINLCKFCAHASYGCYCFMLLWPLFMWLKLFMQQLGNETVQICTLVTQFISLISLLKLFFSPWKLKARPFFDPFYGCISSSV